MKKNSYTARYIHIFALMALLMVALLVRLFVLSVIQQDQWVEAASNQNTKEVVTPAPRGRILDRYGRVVADNRQIFTVTINVSGMKTDEINSSAYNVIKLLEANGDTYVDNFPIKLSSLGVFTYSFDENKNRYLKSLGLSKYATTDDVLNTLRNKYNIDESLDRYDAVKELQETYGVYPPIIVKSMRYTYDVNKISFLDKYGLYKENEEPMSAKDAFFALRKKYKISETLSNEEVRKIFCIREEIKNTGFNRYRSSAIASDVCEETVAQIEELNDRYKGIEISSASVRTYPYGQFLAHVIGYMGSISDSQYDHYVNELGYTSDELIGKDGIEAAFESSLRGTDGVKSILVNSSGDYIETLEESEPVAGHDVYLTIDADLQNIAEDTLEEVIKTVQTGGYYKSKYGALKLGKYPNCQSGATVAIDVETMEVIAMASYPDYDLNIFAEGITSKDWASVQSENPRDPLAPTPLYNNAALTSVQPGSTFKPITAVAALECGLDPRRNIRDKGYITIGDRTFGCSNWNNYRSTHGIENLVTGIQNSCNFYFYCIASGRDWNNNASLNYSEDISIDKIMSVASEFGLGSSSGIEISEIVSPLASAERKMASTKAMLRSALKANASKYWPKSTYEDADKLNEEVTTIANWAEENPDRGTIISRIQKQTTVLEDKVETVTDICKYSYFNQAQWTIGDEFNIAIGQGDNAYTPVQMARYVATLANGGKLRDLTLIKGIEGEPDQERPETQVNVSDSEMETVKEGMRRVVTNGTLASTFRGFPIEVAGKTGTAQKDGKINPADEVAYVKEHLSQITNDVTWDEIKAEMKSMMQKEPLKYTSENDCVDTALKKLSDYKVTQTMIDKYKEDYDNFAWTITFAPKDNPKIAVVTLLVQGGYSYNAAAVNRELIGAYLDVSGDNIATIDLGTGLN